MPRKMKSKSAPVKTDLLGDEAVPTGGFKVNKAYAERFETRHRKQELQRAEEMGLLREGEDSSDDETEDEGDLLTADVDNQIFETIQAIRRKDPKVYKPEVAFFEGGGDSDGSEGSDSGAEKAPKAVKAKKMTAKDVMREQLMAAAEAGRTDAFSDDDELEATRKRRFVEDDEGKNRKIYDAEQAALRNAFLESVKDEGAAGGKQQKKAGKAGAASVPAAAADAAEASGSDSDDDGGLLKIRQKHVPAAGESDGEEGASGSGKGGKGGKMPLVRRDELREFLKAKATAAAAAGGKRGAAGAGGAGKKVAEHADELADPEGFLSAYLRSRVWKEDEEGEDEGAVPHYEDIVREDEADEAELERADNYEAQYNFRFEEAGGGEIVSHARTVEQSMRRKESKRKEERDRRKERKEGEKAAAEAETRRLMNLKRREIQDRVGKIHDVAGHSVDYARLAAAFADELDKEWDGDAYDRKMAALFGEEFYGAGEEEVLAGADAGHGAGGAGGAAWSLDEEVPEAESDAGDAEEEDEDDEEEEAGAGKAKGKGKAGAKEKGPKLPAWVFGDGPRPSWAGPSAEELARGVDGFEGVFKGKKAPGARDTMALDGGEGEEDDEEEEEEEDPAVVGLGGGRRNRHKRKRKTGKALTAVGRAKAALEAEAAAAGAGGVAMDDPDEVLALGFEDVIAGGVKTRMRYREVPAQDFGLEADEILLLDDGDLNKYVGLKRLAPYREAEWQVPPNMRKRVLRELRSKLKREMKEGGSAAAAGAGAGASKKKQSSDAVAAPAEGAAEGEEAAAGADASATADAGEEVKSRKQLKKERRKAAAAAAAAEAAPATASATSAAADSDSDADGAEDGAAAGDAKKKKRRRNRKGKGGAGGEGAAEESAASSSSGAGAAPASDATLSGHKRSRSSGGKKGDAAAKAEKDVVVTLPTGAAIKKSRLASYGL